MAQGNVAQLTGFGGKEFLLNYYGTALVIPDSIDLAAVRVSEQGQPNATRITHISLEAFAPNAALTAATLYIARWALVSGIDSAAILQAQMNVLGATGLMQARGSPWGGQAENAQSAIGVASWNAPYLPATAIVHAAGVIPAQVGGGPYLWTFDDNDDNSSGGPGAIVIPSGAFGQLLVTPLIPYPSTTTSLVTQLTATIRGKPVIQRPTGPDASGLPTANYSTRN